MPADLSDVQAEVAYHLDRIGRLFKAPKLTIVIRSPQLEDGDIILTDDDLPQVVAAIERLRARQGQSCEHDFSKHNGRCVFCSYDPCRALEQA